MPAVSLAAVPRRRAKTVAFAKEIERRNFAGIYCPSLGDSMGLCQSLIYETERIPLGTSIVNVYTRHPVDYAQSAAYLHEISEGRFRFGVGVSHGSMLKPLGLGVGRPLADIRRFVSEWRGAKRVGGLPPLIMAGLRQKMVSLAAEISEGVVFANAARSMVPTTLRTIEGPVRSDFFIGDMIPTCVSEDIEAAKAVNRKTLIFYCTLPNYRNYWKEAGYVEEMEAIEAVIEAGDLSRIPGRMSDRWLADVTLFGSAEQVREGVVAWREAGVKTPILVPSSTAGGQFKALEELFAVFG